MDFKNLFLSTEDFIQRYIHYTRLNSSYKFFYSKSIPIPKIESKNSKSSVIKLSKF